MTSRSSRGLNALALLRLKAGRLVSYDLNQSQIRHFARWNGFKRTVAAGFETPQLTRITRKTHGLLV